MIIVINIYIYIYTYIYIYIYTYTCAHTHTHTHTAVNMYNRALLHRTQWPSVGRCEHACNMNPPRVSV